MLIIESLSTLPPNYANLYLNLIPIIILFMTRRSHLVYYYSAQLEKKNENFQSDSEILGGPVLPLTSCKTRASV